MASLVAAMGSSASPNRRRARIRIVGQALEDALDRQSRGQVGLAPTHYVGFESHAQASGEARKQIERGDEERSVWFVQVGILLVRLIVDKR